MSGVSPAEGVSQGETIVCRCSCGWVSDGKRSSVTGAADDGWLLLASALKASGERCAAGTRRQWRIQLLGIHPSDRGSALGAETAMVTLAVTVLVSPLAMLCEPDHPRRPAWPRY